VATAGRYGSTAPDGVQRGKLYSAVESNEGLPVDYDELPLMAWLSFGVAICFASHRLGSDVVQEAG
jgi:hypothetical protein